MSKEGSDRGGNKKGEADLLTKRRDKRRHLSSSALDLRDPLKVLELAVRFDESRQDEAILVEPLENGKLHDQNQFLEALRFLERQTKPPSTIPPRSDLNPLMDFLRARGYNVAKEETNYPSYALTPIILSGLLSNVRDDSSSVDPLGELVVTCQTMRRAAVKRVRNRQIRLKIQRNILPATSFVLLLLLYVQWIRETIYCLDKLHFMDERYSCDIYSPEYREVCYLAEAHLWTTFEDYLLNDHCRHYNEECLSRKFGSGPLALQARFSRQLVPIEDVLDDNTLIRRDNFRLGKIPRSQPALPMNPATNSSIRPHGWLGASVPSLILGDIIDKNADEITVLDAGCGVGGSLWYFFPDDSVKFSYHGIALSQAEVHFAREFVRRRGMEHENIFFEQRSFDEFLPRNTYRVVLAMESLSYSPNLEDTISNLVSTIQPGGIMVVADEFAVTPATDEMREVRRAPSMNTLSHFVSLMEKNGLSLRAVREYGIEFQFEGYHTWVPQDEVPLWGWLFYPLLPGRSRRLHQLRADQEDLYRSFRARKADDEAGRTSHAMLLFYKDETD